jgi:hypothetical protein
MDLCDFWETNDFAPHKCQKLLDEITLFHKKRPANDFKEKMQEFRRLCSDYYTKDRDVYKAFQQAMGGKKKKKTRQPPPPESEKKLNVMTNSERLKTGFLSVIVGGIIGLIVNATRDTNLDFWDFISSTRLAWWLILTLISVGF